jgi:two-component system phosphate regulon response regulator OmpR
MPEQPHILVVDDDRRLRELLRRYLSGEGYRVTSADSAADAEAKLGTIIFDLMVLDVMMPGEDGIRLTQRLRKSPSPLRHLPILLLTARGESPERIEGLEAGSDDYLVKPFEPRELLLRIQAVLRRAPADAAKEMWIGRWRYDMARGELRDHEKTLRLTEAESGLLKILAGIPGETISRGDLVRLSALPINDRSVDVQVTRLRRKIEPDPKQPRYLVTVRGEGYMLLPDKEKPVS